ncbi:MAG TPA: flagellar hook-basal body complex protein FliE [Hyphomicrobiaceae bacterium]
MISALGSISPVTVSGLGNDRPATVSVAPPGGGEEDFGSVLGETLGRTVAQLENAEKLSIQALRGDAEIREVVDAVMAAEQTLQAAIAIRDKIVTAYLEISRMSI